MSDLDIKIENKEIKVTEVKEGKVTIQQQNNDGTFSPFYNPAQELNRDISVACIQTYFEYYKEKIDKKQKNDVIKNERVIIDAMSATGLRAVRYFKEIERVTKIIANDFDSKAFDLIKINAKKNGDEYLLIDKRIEGFATVDKTKFYSERNKENVHADHFKKTYDNLTISSIGIGSYVGKPDDITDYYLYNAIK